MMRVGFQMFCEQTRPPPLFTMWKNEYAKMSHMGKRKHSCFDEKKPLDDLKMTIKGGFNATFNIGLFSFEEIFNGRLRTISVTYTALFKIKSFSLAFENNAPFRNSSRMVRLPT